MKGEDSFRVCKRFYCQALQFGKRWSTMFIQKRINTGLLKPDGQGKHDRHANVSDEQKNGVISHIDSFPVITSHYCRAKKNKKIFGNRP